MSLDLQQLTFRVDTKELETAISKVGELGSAVERVITPVAKLSKASDEASKGVEKLSKVTESSNDAFDSSSVKLSNIEKYLAKYSGTLSLLRTNQLNVNGEVVEFGSNLTKSEKGMLSLLAASGASVSQLKELGKTMENINSIIGRNPFDQSVQGLIKLQNEIREISVVNDLMARGFNITKDQAVGLSRDIERVTQTFRELGKTEQELAQAIDKVTKETVESANALNILNSKAADQQRIARETADAATQKANALRAIQEAEERLLQQETKLVYVNAQLAKGLSVTSANELYRYEENLKKAGIAADVAAVKVQNFSKQLLTKQGKSPISAMTDGIEKLDKSVNHLARNLSTQFTDIFVSLANGQSFFQVMTQQGGQVADAFRLAGIEVDGMADQLVAGAKGIWQAYKDLGSAFLDLVGRGIKAAGNAIVDFGSKVTGTNSILNATRSIIESLGGDSQKFISIVDKMGASFRVAAGIAAGTFLVALTAITVAFVKLSNEQDTLAKSLAQYGATFGATAAQAAELSRSLTDLGVKSSDAVGIISEMAKAGNLSKDSFEGIAIAATQAQKYVGIAVADTVKQFSELTKDPIKVLTEFGKQTGFVSQEQIQLVKDLIKVGATADATREAIRLLQDGYLQMASSAKEGTSALGIAMSDLKSSVSSVWDEFKNSNLVVESIDLVAFSIRGLGALTALLSRAAKTTVASFAALKGVVFDPSNAKQYFDTLTQSLAGYEKEYKDTIETLRDSGSVNTLTISTEQRSINSEQLKQYEAQSKLTKEILGTAKEQAKEMTKGAYVARRMTEELNAAGKGASYTPELMAKAVKKFGEEWESANKKVDKAVTYTSKIEEKIRDLGNAATTEWNKMFTASEALTKSEAYRLDILDDPVFKELPKREQQRLLSLLDQNTVLEKQVILEKERLEVLRKIWQGTVDAQTKADNFAMDEFANYEEQKRILESNNKDLVFRESLIGKTAQEQKNLTRQYEAQKKIASAQLDLEKKKAAAQEKFAGAADKAQLEELKQLYETEYAEKVKLINKEIAIQAAEDIEASFKDIQSTLADIISTALFEGGKAGQKKLKDVLKAAFSSFVLNVLINPITQGVGGSIGNTLLGTSNSGISSIGTLIGEGFNSYISNTAFGALLSSSAGYAAAIGGGSIAAGSQAAMLAAQTGGFGVAGTALTAQAAGGISGSLGGIYSSLMSNPWTLALGAGLLLFGDDIFGGLFGDAGTAHTGGVGSYSATGGTSYGMGSSVVKGYTGGVAFGADAYSEQTAKGSAELAKGMVTLLDSFAQTFGKEVGYYVGTGFADDTSDDGAWGGLLVKLGDEIIKDWGRGADKWPGREFANGQAGQEQYLAALAKETRDIMKTIAPDWAKSILDSLGNDVTFESLQQALTIIDQINTVFKQLADVFPIFNQLAGDAQTQLLQFFGGVEGLSNALGGYYENFYSEQEKVARQTELLTEAFDSLGYTLPASKAAFRSLVESLDLTTEEGRKTFAGLMQLQQPFSDLNSVIQELSSTVQDEVRRLRGLLSVDSTNSSAALQAQFTTLTAQARAGDATALERLPEISQAIEQAAMLTAVTAADVARVRGWLAASMSDTLGVLGMQVPQFAVGTNYVPQDTLAVVHKGEAIVPKAYNPAANGMSNNSEMVAELRSLKEEVVMLRAETRATAINTNKSTKILERVTQDGESLMVTPTA